MHDSARLGRVTKLGILAVALALFATSPAEAQAPTLEERVVELEARVAELEQAPALGCLTAAVAVSQRPGTVRLVRTRSDAQRRVYLALIDRACLEGARDDYRWPWWKP